jgi:hypothetical protein
LQVNITDGFLRRANWRPKGSNIMTMGIKCMRGNFLGVLRAGMRLVSIRMGRKSMMGAGLGICTMGRVRGAILMGSFLWRGLSLRAKR